MRQTRALTRLHLCVPKSPAPLPRLHPSAVIAGNPPFNCKADFSSLGALLRRAHP